jgi:ubiquinone/menaquinone biosynthesis C-methylase UbiE
MTTSPNEEGMYLPNRDAVVLSSATATGQIGDPGSNTGCNTADKGINIGVETRRIREVYEQRSRVSRRTGETSLDLYEQCAIHEREELLVKIFRNEGVTTLAGLRILDVGCGTGTLLRHLFDFGAEPENCWGVDVLDTRLRVAKHLAPNVRFVFANSAELPFPDESFDLVLQFTVFTSVLSAQLKRRMAAEIVRTLRRGGRFIWYDFSYDNGRNANVRGIGRREIRLLLPGCRLRFWRVTVAPPIGRPAARLYPFLYRVVSELRVLCSHYMCLAEKL